MVDLECGYGGNGSRTGAVGVDLVGGGGGDDGRDGSAAASGGGPGGGGAAVLFNPLAEFRAGGPAEGAGAGTRAELEGRILQIAGDGQAGIDGGGGDRPAAAAARRGRRVWVLHNFLAVRGFHRHRLDGIAAWLANSTLSLITPSPAPEPAEYEYDDDGGDGGWSSSGIGCDDDNNNGSVGGVFRFHRAFDGDSGLPLPGPEGNSSSVAASVWLLLLLGDEPDGGNDFPPITHATL